MLEEFWRYGAWEETKIIKRDHTFKKNIISKNKIHGYRVPVDCWKWESGLLVFSWPSLLRMAGSLEA
jgi:hypothetical protein